MASSINPYSALAETRAEDDKTCQDVPGLPAIFCALHREARAILRPFGVARQLGDASVPIWQTGSPAALVVQSGMGAEATRKTLARFLRHFRPKRIIGVGFCGALIDSLKVGDVIAEGIVSVTSPVLDQQSRENLHRTTGAVAVDMETATLAELCCIAGIPFAPLRVVSDTPGRPLPAELPVFMQGEQVCLSALLACLVRRPALGFQLMRLAGDARLAGRRLASAIQGALATSDPA